MTFLLRRADTGCCLKGSLISVQGQFAPCLKMCQIKEVSNQKLLPVLDPVADACCPPLACEPLAAGPGLAGRPGRAARAGGAAGAVRVHRQLRPLPPGCRAVAAGQQGARRVGRHAPGRRDRPGGDRRRPPTAAAAPASFRVRAAAARARGRRSRALSTGVSGSHCRPGWSEAGRSRAATGCGMPKPGWADPAVTLGTVRRAWVGEISAVLHGRHDRRDHQLRRPERAVLRYLLAHHTVASADLIFSDLICEYCRG